MAQIRVFWPFLQIPESGKLQIFVIFDHFGFFPESSKMAKIRAFWSILWIPDSAKLQIFVIFKGFLAYFADSGTRKIADFRDF